MEMNPLPLVEKASRMGVEAMLPDVLAGHSTQRQIEEFCNYLRTIGICRLFTRGDSEDFLSHLCNSGRAFLHFLESVAPSVPRTSRAVPLFDAVACDDFDTARRIAAAAPTERDSEVEYEDDFLYMRFVLELVADSSEGAATLARYTEVLDGAIDGRLDVCRALFERDEAAFNSALADYMEFVDARYARRLGSGDLGGDDAVTTRRICVEGLALARLAERAGLATESEYTLVPAMARVTDEVAHPPRDAWRQVPE
jgi:hypothetical protein